MFKHLIVIEMEVYFIMADFLNSENRHTNYRFPYKGYGKYEWLTERQLRIAQTMGVKWYPTNHPTQENDRYSAYETVCPAPNICGWFCTAEDETRIKRLEAIVQEDLA